MLIQVTVLWISAFWFVGSWIVPLGAYIAGLNKESLTYRGQALFSLLTDMTEGLAGIAILHRCLSRFHPLPSDWFKCSLRGNWLVDVTLGCLMFPLVNWLSQFNLKLLPLLPSSPVTLSNIEQSIMARDPMAMALYAVVVTVCAPVWEEIIFRGFLLPSLTKYMPVWCSILVSSVAFALAHFNVQRMLPLIFLGVVIGVIYARSRNLFPSILLHSLWNGFVFLDLMNKILALWFKYESVIFSCNVDESSDGGDFVGRTSLKLVFKWCKKNDWRVILSGLSLSIEWNYGLFFFDFNGEMKLMEKIDVLGQGDNSCCCFRLLFYWEDEVVIYF